ncbi:protoglobin domain-containing protein [Bradyrhizobium sp. 2TAF24]|uniref:protoglobin domain-containing protein n=1 Tax=Bradyrhizobium sp. 2TAF24 TaxID=3233011 RepID=UPI003F8E3A4D
MAATPEAEVDHLDPETRLRFMRVDPDTGHCLRLFWAVVEPKLPDILDQFYRHVAAEPRLAGLIGADIPRLKTAQGNHWRRLFNGRFDARYMQGARSIGVMHSRIGLEPRWYIGGYNYVLARLTTLAVERYRWTPRRLASVLCATQSAVMLDMDIAISVYQDTTMAERAVRQTRIEAAIGQFDGEARLLLGGLGDAASGLQHTADTLASGAERALQQSHTVAAASEETSSSVQTIASAMEELTSSVGEIGRLVAESSRMTRTAVEQAESSGTMMQSLASAAQRIGDVVNLITSIAAQTNLLALNATIEAARAGESGKGFAVVAQEVKALAAQTAKATDDISQQVQSIQEATARSVGAIGKFGTTIGAMDEIATAVAAAVEQQGMATSEIARNLQDAAKGTQDVSSNIAGVSQMAGETDRTTAQLRDAAQTISRQSTDLHHQVEAFFAAIRAA